MEYCCKKKHAYLIIAHTNYEQLVKLLMCIDDIRNDIYLHIDSKFVLTDKQIARMQSSVSRSKMFFLKRRSIAWGAYSLIMCEIDLINEMIKNKNEYSYVHLISGCDLPIMNQNLIHSFFEKYNGVEFVEFADDEWINNTLCRLRYYYPLQEILGRSDTVKVAKLLLEHLQRFIVKIQQLFSVNRIKNEERTILGGSQWFSITYECAEYISCHFHEYKRMFKYTKCGDEYLIQTIIGNSDFYNNRSDVITGLGNLRYINWAYNTHPGILTEEDLQSIIQSKSIFARKIDENVDSKIVESIVKRVKVF